MKYGALKNANVDGLVVEKRAGQDRLEAEPLDYASYDETLKLWRENKIPHKHTSNGLAQPREDVRT